MCEIPLEKFWIFLKILKKGLKQKVMVYQLLSPPFFLDLSEPAETSVGSTFPGRNLCLCSRGITPWNCTCRTLDSWPLDGKETNVTSACGVFLIFFPFVCVFVGDVGVFCCALCFFCFSRKIKATVVIKNNGMTTQRLVLLYDSIGLGWHLFRLAYRDLRGNISPCKAELLLISFRSEIVTSLN